MRRQRRRCHSLARWPSFMRWPTQSGDAIDAGGNSMLRAHISSQTSCWVNNNKDNNKSRLVVSLNNNRNLSCHISSLKSIPPGCCYLIPSYHGSSDCAYLDGGFGSVIEDRVPELERFRRFGGQPMPNRPTFAQEKTVRSLSERRPSHRVVKQRNGSQRLRTLCDKKEKKLSKSRRRCGHQPNHQTVNYEGLLLLATVIRLLKPPPHESGTLFSFYFYCI